MDWSTFLGQELYLIIDRPAGSFHPTEGFKYPINYGYVPDTLAVDGEPIDAYYLGTKEPLDEATGLCIAIIERLDDVENKLVVAPPPSIMTFDDQTIMRAVHFQESWFNIRLIR